MQFKNILYTVGANLFALVTSFATGVLLARLLGPTQRGEVAAIQAFPGVLSTVALLGLPEAVVFLVTRRPHRSKSIVTTTLLLLFPLSLGAVLIGYLAMPRALAAQSQDVIEIARLYMLTAFHFSFGSIYVWVAQGLRQFKYWNALRLFPSIVWLIAILSGQALGLLSSRYLITFMIVVPTLSIPVFMVIMWRNLRGPVAFNRFLARRLVSYGLPLTFGALPQMLNFRLDQLLLAAFLSPTLLGMYVVGVTWGGTMTSLLAAIGSVAFPSIAAQQGAEQQRTLSAATRTSILATVVVLPVQVLLTPLVIPLLFGDAFKAAVPSAIVLVAAGGIANLNVVWRNVLNGLGRPGDVMMAELVGLAFTVAGLALLLPLLQLVGAALASVISYAATLLFLTFSIHRRTRLAYREIMVPSVSDYILVKNRLLSLVQHPVHTQP